MHGSDGGQEGNGSKSAVPVIRTLALLGLLGVVLVIVLFYVFVFWTSSIGPYVLATPFPDVNDSYPIYRTIPSNTSYEEVLQIASSFGMSGEARGPPSSSNGVRIVDNSTGSPAELRYDVNSGKFEYSIPEKKYPAIAHSQPDLPSDEEARAIATDYLQERGLLPTDVHFDSVGVQSRIGDGHTTYDMTKHVSFYKEIEGLRVYHAGIGVTLGEGGEVVAVSNSIGYFRLEPDRYATIITPEQAYQHLCENDLVIRPMSSPGIHFVRNISLGYWMEDRSSAQQYLLPVYAFTCDRTDGVVVTWHVWAADPSEMQSLA